MIFSFFNQITNSLTPSSTVNGSLPQTFSVSDKSKMYSVKILFNLKDWIGNFLNPKVNKWSSDFPQNYGSAFVYYNKIDSNSYHLYVHKLLS
jgi:hypothetical protein